MEPREFQVQDGATPKKVVAKSKGSAEYLNDGGFRFSPYESTGESSRDEVVRIGDSCTYVTKGRNPKRVVTLKFPKKDPALCARLQSCLEEFISGFGVKQFEKPRDVRKSKCSVLWDARELKVEVMEGEKMVSVEMCIPLDTVEEMKNMAFNNLQKINQCFTINRQRLLSAFRAASKSSGKS